MLSPHITSAKNLKVLQLMINRHACWMIQFAGKRDTSDNFYYRNHPNKRSQRSQRGIIGHDLYKLCKENVYASSKSLSRPRPLFAHRHWG